MSLRLAIIAFQVAWVSTLWGADEAEKPVERGRYLVHHVAMCIYCHTPKDSYGNLKDEELLRGAPMPIRSPYPGQIWGFPHPDLTSLPGRWGKESLIKFLQTGQPPDGPSPRSPMPPFRMTREDAAAVAEYLESLDSHAAPTGGP